MLTCIDVFMLGIATSKSSGMMEIFAGLRPVLEAKLFTGKAKFKCKLSKIIELIEPIPTQFQNFQRGRSAPESKPLLSCAEVKIPGRTVPKLIQIPNFSFEVLSRFGSEKFGV